VRGGKRELRCSGADRCLAAPCSPAEWSPIAHVTLDESFFRPPNGVSSGSSVSFGFDRSLGVNRTSTSGLQVTPDGKAVLVSKDVGAERWAMSGPLYYDVPGLPPGVEIVDHGWTWQGNVDSQSFRLSGSGGFCIVAGRTTVACCSVSSTHGFER